MKGPGVPKSSMVAEYLRSCAHWRLDRAEESDEGRNARSAIALIDAAVYAQGLDDRERVVVRMAEAGCFGAGVFRPGADAERIVRGWRYDSTENGVSDPAELLDAVAGAAEAAAERAQDSPADPAPDQNQAQNRDQNRDRDAASGRGHEPAGAQAGAASRTRSKARSGSRRNFRSRSRSRRR